MTTPREAQIAALLAEEDQYGPGGRCMEEGGPPGERPGRCKLPAGHEEPHECTLPADRLNWQWATTLAAPRAGS